MRFRSDPTTRRGSRAGDEETSRARVVEGTRASMDFIRARANARDDERAVARAGRGRRPRAEGVGGQRPRRRGSIRRRRSTRSRPTRSTRSIDTDSIDRHRIDGRNRIDGRDAIGSISDSGVGVGGGVWAFSRALWGASACGATDEAARCLSNRRTIDSFRFLGSVSVRVDRR